MGRRLDAAVRDNVVSASIRPSKVLLLVLQRGPRRQHQPRGLHGDQPGGPGLPWCATVAPRLMSPLCAAAPFPTRVSAADGTACGLFTVFVRPALRRSAVQCAICWLSPFNHRMRRAVSSNSVGAERPRAGRPQRDARDGRKRHGACTCPGVLSGNGRRCYSDVV